MTVFANKLKSLFEENHVKIYDLAKNCDLDRTTVYKFIKGDRLPGDKETISKISSYLKLSPSQAKELLECYAVSKMGEENFYRRKGIKEFYNSFYQMDISGSPAFSPVIQPSLSALHEDSVLYGSLSVDNAIQSVILLEAAKENGAIKIVAQPEFTYLFDCLAANTLGKNNCAISHVLCLENSSNNDNMEYNIHCLSTVVKVLLSGCNYQPCFYYDHVASHFTNSNVLPYLIITSEYVMNISYDAQYAMISNRSDHITFFEKIYNDLLRQTSPFITIFNSPADSIYLYSRLFKNAGGDKLGCYGEPCMIHCIPMEIIQNCVTAEMRSHPEVLMQFVNHVSFMRTSYSDIDPTVKYFTEAGLDYFCKSGRFTNLPAMMYSPLPLKYRYEILKNFYKSVSSGGILPGIIKPTSFSMPMGLDTDYCRDGSITMIYTHDSLKYTAFAINEKSLVYAFTDFLKYLADSDLVYDQEATLEIIQKKLDELNTLIFE